MQSTRVLAFTSNVARRYAPKYPRPRPGTSERPAYHAKDPLINNPHAVVTNLEEDNLTFIHRPPPTAPSPFSLTTAPASPLLRPPTTPAEGPLPPLTRAPPASPPHRLSDEKLEMLRNLRYSDPTTYTRKKLARMFKCTQTFVGQVAALKKPERKRVLKIRDEKHEVARQKWSERHSIVKAIAKKRRELW
ncbi:hypothetical protein JR316_0007098 [Psilocybe cubensis]|uniref:Uncharacterized protein n=2 Tax=Psilocybe cubensis TaxID=181762 RepID=A0ACB8GXM3_PSICU|nr:hypothetical protein JR316_0007098 [Psilocybe cubensis]KAH9480498.1 hypothetical protein JR316_0007098 [Psilocybe cubensis]